MTSARLIAAGLLTLVAVAGAVAQERSWAPLPSQASATCPGGLCQPLALTPFFAALDRTPPEPVRILQYGDSHTAGELITTALRTRLQARFPARAVRLEAIGVVGATLSDLADRPMTFGSDPPDLIILAYGSNEGFDDLLNLQAYETLLSVQIARIRRAAPEAALLILGAPEAMRGEGGGACADDLEGRWAPPVMLALVRDVQHRVAAEMGVAFWDWRGRMGGHCAAHRLTLGPDPLMRGDHVHFNDTGGDWIGALLFADLMTARDAVRPRPASGLGR